MNRVERWKKLKPYFKQEIIATLSDIPLSTINKAVTLADYSIAAEKQIRLDEALTILEDFCNSTHLFKTGG